MIHPYIDVIEGLLQDPVFKAASAETNWFPFALRHRDGKKPLKVPTNADDDNLDMKVAACMTLSGALEGGGDGVGYLPRSGSALVGIDLDDVSIDDVEDLIDGSYAEVSPSGNGVRCLLPRSEGDYWSSEKDSVGFFGASNKWFTVTFDAAFDGPWSITDSFKLRSHTSHLAKPVATAESLVLREATRSLKADVPGWFAKLTTDQQSGSVMTALASLGQDAVDDRESWLHQTLSLHHLASHGYSWAKDVWRDWSACSPHFDEEENEATWDSINPDGSRRIASLFHEARETGDWVKPEPARLSGGSLFSDLSAEDEDTKPWLIQDFMRVEGSAAIIGQSGVGKTTLTALWAAAFIAGRAEVAGFDAIERPLNVAWMNAEEEAADLRQHVREALIENGMESRATLLTMGEEVLDRYEEGLSLVVKKRDADLGTVDLEVNMDLVHELVEELKAANIDMLIADPITEFNDGNENDRSDAKKLNRAFKLIAQQAGVAVLYWAHTGKPPEGKRPDWHANDQFSQRGSSQNIGAVKTAGTLTPVMPAGKAEAALRYYAQARDHDKYPNVPNIVRMKLLKVKKCPARLEMFYDLRPSTRDRDIPVAHVVEESIAMGMTADAQDETSRIRATVIGSVLVSKLGVGAHSRGYVNDVLAGVEIVPGLVWAASARADVAKWSDVLSLFKDGVLVDGKVVTSVFSSDTAGYEIIVSA